MKLLVAGDTHGKSAWLQRLVQHAVQEECDAIVVLGDFGYMEQTWEDTLVMNKLSRALCRAGIELYFIDGNHENHPLLWSYVPRSDGFVEVRENMLYIPRGHAWEWDGVRFLGLGGAYSVDMPWRLDQERAYLKKKPNGKRRWWFPTELITDAQVETAIATGEADVMLTHDCPWGVQLPGIDGAFPLSNDNRERVLEVVKAARPYLLLHGHYHMRVSNYLDFALGASEEGLKWHHVQVEGFDCDGAWGRDAWTTVDTDDIFLGVARERVLRRTATSGQPAEADRPAA